MKYLCTHTPGFHLLLFIPIINESKLFKGWWGYTIKTSIKFNYSVYISNFDVAHISWLRT